MEIVYLTLPPHIFSNQVQFGACCITVQWRQVQEKNKECSYIFSGTFLVVFVVFHNKICVFYHVRTILDLFFVRRKCQLDCMPDLLSLNLVTNMFLFFKYFATRSDVILRWAKTYFTTQPGLIPVT